MFSYKFFLCFFLISFPTVFLFSQINPTQKTDSLGIYRLSEVVVTATKTKTQELEVGSSISVIDSTQIAQSNGADFLDLLKNQYGLSISQSGGPGQLAQMYMRGAAPDQVLVEIDGVKMNMPDDVNNSYDFSTIPLDNIQRIEILRGPQSTLYGSDAMAGVINIITKKGNGKTNYFLNLEGGSLNTYKGLFGINGSYENANYSLTLSKAKSRGISAADASFPGNTEPDGYDKYNISSRFGLNVNENVNLDFSAIFDKGNIDLDQFGGAYGDDPTYINKHEQGAYKAEANINGFNDKWEQKIGFSFMRNVRTYDYDSSLYNPASSSSFYQGNSYEIDWQNNLKLIPNHLVTFGIEANKQSMSATYLYNSSLYGTSASDFLWQSLNTISAYLQDQLNIANTSFTTGGIRYDKQSKFGSDLTFRITQAYLIKNTGTKIKATYGTGFKAPSLYDLYDPNYGNPNLKSERSAGWEVGFEQYLFDYNMLIGANYFDNNFSNLFGYDNNYRTININKAAANGIEVYWSANINNTFDIDANYTYTNAKDKTPNETSTNLASIIRRPKNKASLKLNYNFINQANISFDINYAGDSYDEDFSFYPAEEIKLSNYTLIDLSASYNLTNYLKIYGIVKNITNKKYEEVYGYGTPGRTGYLGIKLNFE
jgi:vitamin B12 transporter